MMDFLAKINTKLKMVLFLFILGVVPAGVMFLLLNTYDPETITPLLGLYLVVLIVGLFPAAHVLSDLMILRNVRQVNEYCQHIKQGDYLVPCDLPPDKGEEHDFLRLKRNIYWAGRIIANRETKLLEALRKIRSTQEQILESIEYASLIQNAMLPSGRILREAFKDHFIWWDPRDIVGGDTYWAARGGRGCFVGVIDCTGHGVPGAFVTLIVHSFLDKLSMDDNQGNPASVLQYINRRIRSILGQNSAKARTDDGLEAALCFIDPFEKKLTFSGANLPLFYRNNGQLKEIRGDRAGVGYSNVPLDFPYTNHQIELTSDMQFYVATDGLFEQVGGRKHLPLGKRKLKAMIDQVHPLPFSEQKTYLMKSLDDYMGEETRRDDLTVLGFSPRI